MVLKHDKLISTMQMNIIMRFIAITLNNNLKKILKIYLLTNKQKNVSKQIENNNHVCIVAYDGESWIRIHCDLIDDSNNMEAKKAVIKEFDWAEEAGYTLENPDFQVLYLANATATISDSDGQVLENYKF